MSAQHEDEAAASSQVPQQHFGLAPPPFLRATVDMCHYCFDLLVAHLTSSRRVDEIVPTFLRTMPSSAEAPIFVTWDKARPTPPCSRAASWLSGGGGDGGGGNCSAEYSTSSTTSASPTVYEDNDDMVEFELRGCIGTLAPRPLRTAIGEFALTSALRDRRFNPISPHEIPHLRVAVSLLVNYEECLHCHDWVIGVHGIIITFTHGRMEYNATYLPEVAKEQGWNQEEAVISLIRKAGFNGQVCSNFLAAVRCTRYESSKQRLTWKDYVSLQGKDPLEATTPRNQSGSSGSGSGKSSSGRRWKFPFL